MVTIRSQFWMVVFPCGLPKAIQLYRVSSFGGMERWNGTVEWNGGMERWNGIVEWNGGMTTPIDRIFSVTTYTHYV